MGVLAESIELLTDAATRGSSCVVGFSGGKDSLVCLDLARKVFEKVSAYHMWFVPGLACVEEALDAARRRWGVEIVQYPHWNFRKMLQAGVYCFNSYKSDDIATWTMSDLYRLARADAAARWVVHGAKNSDSVWRRRTLAAMNQPDVLHPLKEWSKKDVLAYLHANRIPVPDASKGNTTGIDLTDRCLYWLHDKHPADFKRLCEFFPFAEAVVWRRKWHGEATGET